MGHQPLALLSPRGEVQQWYSSRVSVLRHKQGQEKGPATRPMIGDVLFPLHVYITVVSSRQLNASWEVARARLHCKAAGPMMRLNPFETRRVDVAVLQDGVTLPKEAHWTSVVLTTNGLPDEVMAIAASHDETLRYGAQTPFSDQLSFRWEGGLWEYDAQHDSIITAGNGGTKPIQAAFTIFYNQGTQRYDLEQTLQPDEQMWIDVGKLIQEHVPDENGNTLPAELTSGSYEFRDLSNKGIGTLFESKIIYDKTYGHVAYGCAWCCGFTRAFFWFNPLAVPLSFTSDNGVDAHNACTGLNEDVSGDFNFNWTTADTSIATVDAYGTHTGVSLGSTTSQAWGDEQGNDRIHQCPRVTLFASGGANVIPITFAIAYSSYIPADHVTGPSSCNFAGTEFQLIYMGDANRNTYRTTESIQVTPDTQLSSGFFQGTGQTRNYGYGSPSNGSTLSSADEDGIPNDCYLWNNAATATPAFSQFVNFPYAHQGQVEFSGASSNPLESTYAPITWDMRTVVDTTNPQSPTAYVNYNHTCYPSHQIKVNNQVIYLYTPPRNDLVYITGCLYFQTGKITGQTNPTTVPPN